MNLINELLDVARLEEGRMALNLGPVRVEEVMQAVVDTLSTLLQAKGQRLSVNVQPSLPPVLADRDRLIQIVTNLLSNATKYTPEGGVITVSCSKFQVPSAGDAARPNLQTGTWNVELSVQDTGIGISAEEQKQLFSRFYRVDSSLTRQAGGAGLGLYIVKSLVEKHGGQITVASTPGQGSTFSITLPVAL